MIYLAAGNSRRFGTNKLLHVYRGKHLYRYGLDMLEELCYKRSDCILYVVSQYREILEQAKKGGVQVVYSPDSYKGMSYTIEAALHAVGDIPEEDFLVFVVADQPGLTEYTVEKLLAAADFGVETASVRYGSTPGSPTLFSARLMPELLALVSEEAFLHRWNISRKTYKHIHQRKAKRRTDNRKNSFVSFPVFRHHNIPPSSGVSIS